jgi:hypothetical protein
LVRSACQQITKEWWERGRLTAMPYSSPYVVEEAGAGDPQAASKRLNTLREIPLLPVTPEIPAGIGGVPSAGRRPACQSFS